MALRATPLLLVAVAALLVPLSSAAQPRVTADQLLVRELETAAGTARSALRSLARPTHRREAKAAAELRRTVAAVEAARKVAPRAVGALEARSMRTALQQSRVLATQAATDIARGRYAAARTKIRKALKLKTIALREFGTPLAKDFPSFAVNRNFRNVPAYRNYSGVTATAGEEVVEIIIGAANRETAKAGEPSETVGGSAGLPITELSAYQIQDPIGAYTTNRCSLDAGLITCPLRPTLRPRHSFTLAFAPKLERGTQILLKFRAASGRRSHALFTIR